MLDISGNVAIGPIFTGPVTVESEGALWKALYVQDDSKHRC
jgi:hypothetical protein